MSSEELSHQSDSSLPEKHVFLDELQDAITSHRAAFCCGGAVQVVPGQDDHFEQLSPKGEPCESPSVVLRWDVPNDTAVRKLKLPPDSGTETAWTVDDLLKDCSPATFGRQGVDVIDENYRKAAKLDNTQFATSFNPYEFGIVDSSPKSFSLELPSLSRMVRPASWRICRSLQNCTSSMLVAVQAPCNDALVYS